MNDSDKLDLGPLDPSRDEARWQLMLSQTARRAREERRRARTVSGQLFSWGPAAVAAAAALALVIWGGSGVARGRAADRTRAADRAEQAALLSRWALNDEVPPPEVLLDVMGASHGDE